MSRAGRDDRNLADLDELIGKITVEASGDDETLWAFRQAFEDDVTLPSDGFVIGEPVSVTAIDYETTGRFCAASTATDSVSGDWVATARPGVSSSRCCGSTRPTTRACGSWSRTSEQGRHGRRTGIDGEAGEGSR